MNKQERDGKIDVAVGGVKQATGIVTDNEDLEKEGRRQRTRGKFRRCVGAARGMIAHALSNAAAAIRK